MSLSHFIKNNTIKNHSEYSDKIKLFKNMEKENNLVANKTFVSDLVVKVFNSLDVTETTKKEYLSRIKLFVCFVQEKNMGHNTFLEYKKYLRERNDFSVATKNKYLATARVFLKEITRRQIIPVDVTLNIKSFNQSKKHKVEGLKQAEIEKLVQELNRLSRTPKNARKRAFFCLLALQGLRQIEIIRLDFKDVDLVNRTAFVKGKGMDDKELVYLAPQTIKSLRDYIKISKIRSGSLFQSLGNRKTERLSTMTIKREMGELFEKLNISKTTHGFRHYFITKLLENLDVRDARKFSRHKSLEMLIVYDDEIDLREKSTEVFKCFSSLNVT